MKETTLKTYMQREIRGDYSGNDFLLILSKDGRDCYACKPSHYKLALEVSSGISGDVAIFNGVNYSKLYPEEGIVGGPFNEEIERLEKLLLVIPQEIPA